MRLEQKSVVLPSTKRKNGGPPYSPLVLMLIRTREYQTRMLGSKKQVGVRKGTFVFVFVCVHLSRYHPKDLVKNWRLLSGGRSAKKNSRGAIEK